MNWLKIIHNTHKCMIESYCSPWADQRSVKHNSCIVCPFDTVTCTLIETCCRTNQIKIISNRRVSGYFHRGGKIMWFGETNAFTPLNITARLVLDFSPSWMLLGCINIYVFEIGKLSDPSKMPKVWRVYLNQTSSKSLSHWTVKCSSSKKHHCFLTCCSTQHCCLRSAALIRSIYWVLHTVHMEYTVCIWVER